MRLIKLANGGGLDPQTRNTQSLTGNIVPALGTLTSFVDALDTPNQYGRQSTATNLLKGASTGASMGASAGPAGAIAGGVGGLVMGLVNSIQQKREERKMKINEASTKNRAQLAQYAARAASDQYLTTGRPGEEYFAYGGNLKTEFMKMRATGGKLSKLSSDSSEVKGPSHARGGVKIGNNEVEGGETIKGNYVLSHRLGFAQLHKPIARAIGKIEQKPVNAINLKSLKRLRDQEQSLIIMQEYIKGKHNLK